MTKRRRPNPDEGVIRFVCVHCGREYEIPEHPGSRRPDERRIVRIGGETWCEPCAKERHHRSYDITGLLGPVVIYQQQTPKQ